MTIFPFTEIPGPTRKVPPPKHGGSDTNEISNKNTKNVQNSGKDSHPQINKNNFQNPEYEDNYSSSEDEDLDSLGDKFLFLIF
jgi:hypothetical protein